MKAKRDFTATTLVVHLDRVLLHMHRKLGLMLPLGGHIEPDELPDHAAVREVREESGLEVELYRPDPTWNLDDVAVLARPVAVLLEDIEPGHQHIDMIYLASLAGPEADRAEHPAGNGSEELLWLSAEDIERTNMPDNVRELSRYALSVLGGGGNQQPRRPGNDMNDILLDPDGPRLA